MLGIRSTSLVPHNSTSYPTTFFSVLQVFFKKNFIENRIFRINWSGTRGCLPCDSMHRCGRLAGAVRGGVCRVRAPAVLAACAACLPERAWILQRCLAGHAVPGGRSGHAPCRAARAAATIPTSRHRRTTPCPRLTPAPAPTARSFAHAGTTAAPRRSPAPRRKSRTPGCIRAEQFRHGRGEGGYLALAAGSIRNSTELRRRRPARGSDHRTTCLLPWN